MNRNPYGAAIRELYAPNALEKQGIGGIVAGRGSGKAVCIGQFPCLFEALIVGSGQDLAGLDAFRASVAYLAPFAADRVGEIKSWDDVKLLTVAVDRLPIWYRAGLLCIGDAAHAMSPIGGVGINLAVQDAVAAANILAGPLRSGKCGIADLHDVQHRRELPTRLTQFVQVQVQKRMIARVLSSTRPLSPPLIVRMLRRFPLLRRVSARMVGVGARPEHVRTPAA